MNMNKIKEKYVSMSNVKKITMGLVLLALVVVLILVFRNDSTSAKSYDYDDFSEYITVGDYKSVGYEVEEAVITDEEVQAQIQENLTAAQVTNELTEGVLTEEDTANISYVGKIDGEEFDGGSAENYSLDLANSTFIDGFAEGLVGKTIGDTVSIDLTFPDDYSSEDLAGKDVVFDVTINSRTVVTVPEYDEAFIKESSDYDNKKDYEKNLKATMLEDKIAANENEAQTNMFLTILDSSEIVEYPEKELTEAKESSIQMYKTIAEEYGMEYETFVEEQMGVSVEEFEVQASEYAESVVKQNLVIYSIAKDEGISVTDKEYQQFLDDALEEAGYDRESFKAANNDEDIEVYAEENDFYSKMLMETVIDKLVEYNK
ncbi:MAG: trigger factor [Peptostreptococcaceae bacterium]|nr:trigger factor [Peptostreptococcaceae bacterium]